MAAVRPAEAPGGSRLVVEGLSKAFYGVRVLSDISFSVEPGELLGLIGPNGSGKTTAIDCVTGFLKADAGRVLLDGRDTLGASPDRLARQGLIRTFQTVRIFPTLPVRQNVAMGAFATGRRRLGLFPERSHWQTVERDTEELIDSFGLRRLADAPAGTLSYGQRKLVEFAAGLICRPRIILFDEPVAAVNPTLARTIRRRILDLHEAGISILLIEHNMELVMDICQRLVVLDHGVKIADGPPREVIGRKDVQEAYFGR